MSAENNFVKAALEHLYAGRWVEYGAGLGSRVEVDGVGILINYDDEAAVKFYAGAATDLALNSNLCDRVAAINVGTHIGAFYLSRIGDSNEWSLIYFTKIFKSWLEPDSGVSAQILLDILDNIPGFVNRAVGYLDEHISMPITRWDTATDYWWTLLTQHT